MVADCHPGNPGSNLIGSEPELVLIRESFVSFINKYLAARLTPKTIKLKNKKHHPAQPRQCTFWMDKNANKLYKKCYISMTTSKLSWTPTSTVIYCASKMKSGLVSKT